MMIQTGAPYITTLLDQVSNENEHYKEGIRSLLKKILPNDFFFGVSAAENRTQRLLYLNDSLPIVKWSDIEGAPCNLSIIMMCKYRLNAANFFYDMINCWLMPQKRLNVDLFFAADFYLPETCQSAFTIAEIIVRLKSSQEVEDVKRNLRSVDTEIRLGVVSNYHANRIMEFKGLPTDGKIAMIQEKIGSLIQSRSKDFDKNIFSQMQRFLVTCVDEFKNTRDYHHISRIISLLYLMRKLLKQKVDSFPNRRHLILKFLKTRLALSSGEKNVLGVLVGLNFLREHEVFEKNHLITAVKNYLPHVKFVENSFILDKGRENNIQTVYMEVEKEDGADFSFEEIQLLRESLPDHLKGHIEYLMHPIFMPRNEEEILRNIMALSRQLKYVNDIPQVIISFDEQLGAELAFTVIFLRVLKPKMEKMEEIVKQSQSKVRLLIDRTRKVGNMRRSYAKEATVLRVLLPMQSYFRPDHSVDLYKARKDVAAKLEDIFGPVRDYNGGMIYHQNEHFTAFKTALGQVAKQNEILLEKFFYSIAPAHMRSVLDVDALKTFFLMLVQFNKTSASYQKKPDFLLKEEAKRVFAVLPAHDSVQKKAVMLAVQKLNIPSHRLISYALESHDKPSFGYLYLCDDKEKQKLLIKTIQQTLDF